MRKEVKGVVGELVVKYKKGFEGIYIVESTNKNINAVYVKRLFTLDGDEVDDLSNSSFRLGDDFMSIPDYADYVVNKHTKVMELLGSIGGTHEG